jgi:hypothetical protein
MRKSECRERSSVRCHCEKLYAELHAPRLITKGTGIKIKIARIATIAKD